MVGQFVNQIITSEKGIVFVFGEAKDSPNSPTRYIGVNLDTGNFVSVQEAVPTSLLPLTIGQLDCLSEAIKLKIKLNKLIGITGKARTGKDTLAEHMKHRLPAISVPFAFKLKQIHKEIYGESTRKDRHGLIGIGQKLREFDPDIWIIAWLKEVTKRVEEGQFVIAQDVRQYNEYSFLKSMGAIIIKLTADEDKRIQKIKELDGEEALKYLKDKTETELETFDYDFELHNTYNEILFATKVNELVGEIIKRYIEH